MSTPENQSGIRVWAEEHAGGGILVTWEIDELADPVRDRAADTRSIAAMVGVLRGVEHAEPTSDGVRVRYDDAIIPRAEIANAVRAALSDERDLKTRANEMMKRAPTYISLARSLARDERVSPMPEVARQAAASRATPLRAAPLRMIPGFQVISRVYTLAPVLRGLSTWSRDSSPEVVDEHLTRVGLTREILDRDLATSQEAMLFARSYASETTSKVAARATTAATQARDAAREWAANRNETSPKSPKPPRRYEP